MGNPQSDEDRKTGKRIRKKDKGQGLCMNLNGDQASVSFKHMAIQALTPVITLPLLPANTLPFHLPAVCSTSPFRH